MEDLQDEGIDNGHRHGHGHNYTIFFSSCFSRFTASGRRGSIILIHQAGVHAKFPFRPLSLRDLFLILKTMNA